MLDTPAVFGQKVLPVDDVSGSGRTLAMVVALVVKAGADVQSRCLSSKSQTLLEPDFVTRRNSKWNAFSWSSLRPVTA